MREPNLLGGYRSPERYSRDPTPFESIWAFTPDGKGAGSWKEILGPTETNIFPTDIIRPAYGAFCSDDSYGYYIGGWVGGRSTRWWFDDVTGFHTDS